MNLHLPQSSGIGRGCLTGSRKENRSAILEDGDLKSFKKAKINGRAFLHSSREFFQSFCGLSPGASLALESLANEVKELTTVKHSELLSFIPYAKH
jgi:hypothetical protein